MRQMTKVADEIAFTVVNLKYIHMALNLRDSFLAENPDKEFKIFILDDLSSYEEDFIAKNDLVKVNEDISSDINIRAFYYEITELSTSVKPDIFKYLFLLGYNFVTYLDPDIHVFKRFTHIENALKNSSIVVTPHLLSPLPAGDGKRPNELDILRTGIFNLGFIAMKNNIHSNEFVSWWSERLKDFAFESYLDGMYTDQKWVNLLVGFSDQVFVLRHPGYNVAYWNMHERQLSLDGDIYKVNNLDLHFFHFSGFNFEKPYIFSKNQNRFQLDEVKSKLLAYYYTNLMSNYRFVKDTKKYSIFSDNEIVNKSERLVFYHMNRLYKISVDPFSLSKKEYHKYITSLREKNYQNFILPLDKVGKNVPSFIRKQLLRFFMMDKVDKSITILHKVTSKYDLTNILVPND